MSPEMWRRMTDDELIALFDKKQEQLAHHQRQAELFNKELFEIAKEMLDRRLK